MSEKFRRVIGKWRCTAFVLMFIILLLAIALVLVIVFKDRKIDDLSKEPCGANTESTIDTSEPDRPGPFHHLTRREMRGILQYLLQEKSLNMVKPEKYVLNSTYLYYADLLMPPKVQVLNFLDNGGDEPKRAAKVVLLRGDAKPAVVEELEVGPLPDPTYHKRISYNNKRRNPVDYSFRPITAPDFINLEDKVFSYIDEQIGNILMENYGAQMKNCGDKCLKYYISFVSSGITKTKARLMWIWLTHGVEFFLLNPLDMAILVDMTSNNPAEHMTKQVWFQDRLYDSLGQLKKDYTKPNTSLPRIPFPDVDRDYFSTMYLRGNPQPMEPKSGPKQIEPDGKRYSIKHQQIKYLGWDLNFKMNTQTGPQLYDVKYLGERIAYEIGLQEVAVFYSGHSPNQKYADYVDSVIPLSINAKTLVPGVDCPDHATFMENLMLLEGSSEPVGFKQGVCVFEHNMGIPMRRHSSYVGSRGGRYFSGMPDNVLIIRTILTVGNYDYISDFILHQGGGMEVKIASTGYLSTSMYSPAAAKYGFPLHGRVSATLHHHMFHYKVDLDIKGTSNRFETLDIKLDTVSNKPWSDEDYYQTRIQQTLKQTEEEAAYKFNFDSPKYLLFSNQHSRTKTGIPRSYRIHPVGISKQILPQDIGNEPAITWSRYQVAVTRYHDDEPTSSSSGAMTDAGQPVINFQSFISDNEDIVDKDLVAWVTMGIHHIPHTEDLPTTPTIGGQLQFFLLPYNYFEEDASMSSRDAIRVEFKNPNDVGEGVRVERYGQPENSQCYAPKTYFDENVNENPSLVLNIYDTPGLV